MFNKLLSRHPTTLSTKKWTMTCWLPSKEMLKLRKKLSKRTNKAKMMSSNQEIKWDLPWLKMRRMIKFHRMFNLLTKSKSLSLLKKLRFHKFHALPKSLSQVTSTGKLRSTSETKEAQVKRSSRNLRLERTRWSHQVGTWRERSQRSLAVYSLAFDNKTNIKLLREHVSHKRNQRENLLAR